MPLLPPTFIGSLDPTNPRGTDIASISDDYHRMIQESCRMTFPNCAGEVSSTHQDLNLVRGYAAAGTRIMTGEAGTAALFMQATAPVGWTISTLYDGRMIVVGGQLSSGIVPGGQTGGTASPDLMNVIPTHNHGDVTISASMGSAGSHRHEVLTQGSGATDPLWKIPGSYADSGSDDPFVQRLAKTDTVANHSHSLSVTGTTQDNAGANWEPRYATGIICTLNA